MTPTYLGDIELNEDTLAHYGVKGMKWRRHKTKASLNSNRHALVSRKRNITGKGTGGKKGSKIDSRTKNQLLADRLNNARTNEERAALATAYLNSNMSGAKATKKGDEVHVKDYGNNASGNINQKAIESARKNIKSNADAEAEFEKKRKKKGK